MDLAAQSIGLEDGFKLPVSSRTLQGTAVDPGTHVPGFEGIAKLILPLPPPLKLRVLVHMIPPKFVVPFMEVFAHGPQINMAVEALPRRSKSCEDVHALPTGFVIPLI
jgi:hypothetical protein